MGVSELEFPTLEAFVGNTPLVRLQRLTEGLQSTVLVKLEGNNPAGSVKDRPALNLIRQAEARGDIAPGDTLIEFPSCWNCPLILFQRVQNGTIRSSIFNLFNRTIRSFPYSTCSTGRYDRCLIQLVPGYDTMAQFF